jgi:hypothetical protein
MRPKKQIRFGFAVLSTGDTISAGALTMLPPLFITCYTRRKPCMKLSAFFFAASLFFILSSLLPPALWPQDFSSIERDLSALENLIHDTLENSAEQQKQLDDLRKNLIESGELIGSYESIIAGQENLLRDLRTRLAEMSETYRTQSSLSARYERRSRFWKIFTFAAVPAAAILSGGLVWALK